MSRDEKILIVLVIAAVIAVGLSAYFLTTSYPTTEYTPGYMMEEGW